MNRSIHHICILLIILLAACSPAKLPEPARDDTIPRIAVVSAFEPETRLFLKEIQDSRAYVLNGRKFTTGVLGGQDVVVFLSGESMVNAAMTIQMALDHFNITALVFSGIAGGVNPGLSIGDVVVPAEWAQYQESLFARQKGEEWGTGLGQSSLGHYGMMYPQPVSVTRQGGRPDHTESKFWFAVDPGLLEAARTAAAEVGLKKCPKIGTCLGHEPKVVVGGRGVSGPSFVDNAEYRQWVWETFEADALDMESAAAAHVAYANNVPFIAFRSLSDLAGGGSGANEMVIFLQLAAENSARLVLAFLTGLEP